MFYKFFIHILILLISLCCLQIHKCSKHRIHRYKCPILKQCKVYKHKICGSDGQFYDSYCHLRKASCKKGIKIKLLNFDQCALFNLLNNYQIENSSVINNEFNNLEIKTSLNLNDFNKQKIHKKSFNTNQFSTKINKNQSIENECSSNQYESMKYYLLQKVMNNDQALLFAQLDENKDGVININELWKKSIIFKPTVSFPCLITDLMQNEDQNHDDLIDFSEFQNAFKKMFKSNNLDVNMVSLDESLNVKVIQTHLNDNVEIRCDIVGKPKQPFIRWYRNNVNLASLNNPNIKVFNDGSLYLSNVILSFVGNYTCQAENNSFIKQTHVVVVIIPPIVNVDPNFHWATIGSSFSISCEYTSLFDQVQIAWFKNDEPIVNNQRITILNNNSKLELNELTRSDTGAYTCRAYNQVDGAYSQDTVSLVVQNEPVSETINKNIKSRLWIFHKNGVNIHSTACSGLLHEMNARDYIPINGLTLCGNEQNKSSDVVCQWSENSVQLNDKIYIGQPNLNRVIVFDTLHLSVIQVLATDPRPMKLWLVSGIHEQRIWLLCYGSDLDHKLNLNKKFSNNNNKENYSYFSTSIHQHKKSPFILDNENISFTNNEQNDLEWRSTSHEQQLHNRKTVQVLRISSNSIHNENIIHLQPIDGHFDLVYNLFLPRIFDNNIQFTNNLLSTINPSLSVGGYSSLNKIFNSEFSAIQKYAYATHWDERTLIKIDMNNFKYIKSISLADCHPNNAIFTQFGLLILQCETPVTHQLNGQLILDQITDSIIAYNTGIKAHKAYLSPNEQFLINIYHNKTNQFSYVSSTIYIQKVTQSELQLLYDIKTTLKIVDCDFVWKNGNFDAVLVSASSDREDLIYLTLIDGKVELINGIGKPSKDFKRKISIKRSNKLGAITSAKSVFIVNFINNRVQCETDQAHLEPNLVVWT